MSQSDLTTTSFKYKQLVLCARCAPHYVHTRAALIVTSTRLHHSCAACPAWPAGEENLEKENTVQSVDLFGALDPVLPVHPIKKNVRKIESMTKIYS